ncbi:hypothetical protein MMAGJ_11590 [Mycolicibacterium mageritense]|uniref:Uncharacterized protein n=1 Tax=Mycolicibacterium mageritense TaxID=53462 RepID=A0ABM7HMY3_MYCME|nr:hypothetical protein MMAGJ_11590 [Mycolicibacterium mageritense]GJJ17776.1 hypothetical protein MTY414_14490 [Mycolicibacterium mageritense]
MRSRSGGLEQPAVQGHIPFAGELDVVSFDHASTIGPRLKEWERRVNPGIGRARLTLDGW